MIRLNDITSRLLSYHPKADSSLVEKAYVYSAKVHKGQVRLSGEPYLSHPLEVSYILTQMKMDVISVVAGLLHDTLEDTQAELADIERLFGRESANIVDGVTKIGKVHSTSREERQAENMRKMILAMATDIRVIMVKLADRLHNMRTLGFQTPEKQESIARETLDIYAPLAGRMGIYWLKSSLEDLCLFYLEPGIHEQIRTGIAEHRGAREAFIREVKFLLSQKLEEAGIKATLKGRHKHFFSIYKKMKEQNLSVNQVYDIVACRVIVNSLKECYEVLGHIHSMWKPVPGRFKDYISMPKANMYQSLHTTVIGPLGQGLEVQIRTWEMDKLAEEGIASHWKYKEGLSADQTDEQQFSWLRQLLEWQQNLNDPEEFLESVRMDLFPNEVYVFTPQGHVKEFPRGATPVDFAYSIHSDIGDHCVGARVNGKMVSFRHELENGDIVEIMTSPKQQPRKDWLDFVKTPRARTKIRNWIKRQERDQSIQLGKELLEKESENEHVSLPNITRNDDVAAVSEELSFHSVDDLLANIGYGKVSVKQVLGRIKSRRGIDDAHAGLMHKVVSRIKRKKSTHGIKVKGLDNMLVRFANCCSPLPGEKVKGYITRGRGVTVHKRDCRHVLNADQERVVDVEWEPTEKEAHLARLRITSMDKKGILAEVSAIMAAKDANIIHAEVHTTEDRKGESYFTIEVEGYKQLQDIVGAVKKVKDVLVVERVQAVDDWETH